VNRFSDSVLSPIADGRLFHMVGTQKTKFSCPVDVCTVGNCIRPADAVTICEIQKLK